jgi:hypothetical protein
MEWSLHSPMMSGGWRFIGRSPDHPLLLDMRGTIFWHLLLMTTAAFQNAVPHRAVLRCSLVDVSWRCIGACCFHHWCDVLSELPLVYFSWPCFLYYVISDTDVVDCGSFGCWLYHIPHLFVNHGEHALSTSQTLKGPVHYCLTEIWIAHTLPHLTCHITSITVMYLRGKTM